MIKKIVSAAALVFVLTSPAGAFHCPKDMAAIDAALPSASLSEADMAKVKELRAKGEELHNAGKHKESVEVLGEAKKLLGIQ